MYATEAASRIGQLMMEDLVNMHKEFRQFYGPEAGAPTWMKWDTLELLPLELKNTVFGADGTDFGCWMPLYRYCASYILFNSYCSCSLSKRNSCNISLIIIELLNHLLDQDQTSIGMQVLFDDI